MSDTVYPPVVQPPMVYPPATEVVLPPTREIEDKEAPELFAVPATSLATPRASDVGTHLFNPLMVGKAGEAGVALLSKRVSFTYAVGSFTGQLIKFPAASQLLTIYVSIITPFNGTTPTLNFGRTAASLEFGTTVLSGAAGTTVTIPVTAALVTPSWSLYMSLVLTAASAGECMVCMVYAGAPLKTWQ